MVLIQMTNDMVCDIDWLIDDKKRYLADMQGVIIQMIV
jgi:hypothetical protein